MACVPQADIAKQDGKPARKSKEAPVPKGRRATAVGDSGNGSAPKLAAAGKGLLKKAVAGDEETKKRPLKVWG